MALARPSSPLKVIGQRYGAGMLVRYRYRIYPSPGHQKALARALGCTRVVYNDCLRLRETCHAAGEKISDTEVQRRVITLAKSTPERAWLAEVASVPLVQACRDARRAYRNWFDSLSGRRKGHRVGHPKFRSKRGRQSIRLTRNGFALHGSRLYIAKVGDSQVCSACGVKDGPKPLHIRQWSCLACETVHDRDVNAAKNILAAGRADKSNACGGQVSPAAMLAPADEAGTLRGAA